MIDNIRKGNLHMRRIFVILISIMMLLSFAGCGKEAAQEFEQPAAAEESISETETVEETEVVTEPVTEPTADSEPMTLEAMLTEREQNQSLPVHRKMEQILRNGHSTVRLLMEEPSGYIIGI